ncbi:MAG: hypothetical protein PHT42_00650, partial [Thermotogota bacterium]|nr:hypothetical protein [Thermotogota bacterium]
MKPPGVEREMLSVCHKKNRIKSEITRLPRILWLLGIGCLLVLFSSCQYLNRSLEQGTQLEVLREMLLRYTERMDTMSARIDRLEEQLLQTRRSADTLQAKVEKNYLMLLTLQSSLTYWEYMNTPPDLSALLQTPETIPDMAAIEAMVREQIASEMERFREEVAGQENVMPQQLFATDPRLQSEINKLEEDYRQLRWMNYRDNP